MSITWLASYPKSGNTWMRVFLTNYLRDSETPADINELERTPIASCRQMFDRYSGLASSHLTDDEIDRLRPEVYRHYANRVSGPLFMKVHDAFQILPDGQALFPADATAGAIHIVRNPLDVLVSGMAHYNVEQVDNAITGLSQSPPVSGGRQSLASQLRQVMYSWSDHARSWTEAEQHFPVCVIRYEDMLLDPEVTFARVVRFSGLPLDRDRLQKAIRFSSFRTLQQQEQQHGFRERVARQAGFFRSGRIGSWQGRLTEHQVRRVLDDHHDVLRQFDYLTETGDFVFARPLDAPEAIAA